MDGYAVVRKRFNMRKYQNYIIASLFILVSILFILTCVHKRVISIELIDVASHEDYECPHFETISKDNELWLVSYGMKIDKVEYCPLYVFTHDRDLLRNSIESDSKSMSHIFFHMHPYYITYKASSNKIFTYRLRQGLESGRSGFVYPIINKEIE